MSDKVLTLDLIQNGDVILADRGFHIADELAIRGARLEMPAFTKGKKQLSASEIEHSRQLAHVRIHVEQVIGQLKKKYTLLQGTLPITMIKRQCNVDLIDKILVVTAALTNLS